MRTRGACLGIALCVAAAYAEEADGQLNTAFTYQGRLTDGPAPASGTYDFEFKLFDAPTGGSMVGSPFPLEDQPVSNGLFTVQLDFGPDSLNGAARWLEIGVRPGISTTPHTALSPRQALTPSPYALGLALPFVVETSQPGNVFKIMATDSGRITTGAFHATGLGNTGTALEAANYGLGNAAAFTIDNPESGRPAVWSQTNGSGPAIAGSNRGTGFAGAFEIDNPTSNAAALFAATTGTGLAGHFEGRAYFAGNVGIGTDTPAAPLEVALAGPGGHAIELNQRAEDNEIHINLRNNNGFWHISGPRSFEPSHQLGFFWNDNADFHHVMSLQSNGNVGIGTDNPQVPLQVDGVVGPDNVSLLVAGLGRFGNGIQVDQNIHGGPGNELSLISTLPNQENASSIRFATSDGSGQTERMRVTPEGNVGIGTADPAYRLDVHGVIRTTEGIRFPDGTKQTTAASSSSGGWPGLRGVQEFASPGDHEWTAPADVHRVMLEIWGGSGGGGGGGGGGYGHGAGTSEDPWVSGGNGGIGGGGGAGAYVKTVLDVIPGETYIVRVGEGGGGGTGGGIQSGGQNGGGGTPSQFLRDGISPAVLVQVGAGTGGHGGTAASGAASGTAGAGGTGGQAGSASGIRRDGGNGGMGGVPNRPGPGACGSVSLPGTANFTWPGSSGGVGGPMGFAQFTSSSSPTAGTSGAAGSEGYAVLHW